MHRLSVYITKAQFDFLKNVNETPVAEHIRIALSDYIKKLKNERVSESQSKREGE